MNRQEATVIACRHFQAALPDAHVRLVDARLVLKRWVVNFWKLLPPDAVESPGVWTIYVDAETGRADWLHDLRT